MDGGRVAARRGAVDLRSAGVGQSENPGDLVEGLTGGVVEGLAEKLHIAHEIAHEQQRGVSAADQQRDGGVFDVLAGEQIGGDVPDEVVDGVQRLVEADGERLGGADADHERSGQTRPARDGHGIHVGEGDAGLGDGCVDRRLQSFEVRPGGDLGHDPAEAGVLVHRARDGVAEQGAAPDDADAGLVATGLDAEHKRFTNGHEHTPPICVCACRSAAQATRSSFMTTASTSSGW